MQALMVRQPQIHSSPPPYSRWTTSNWSSQFMHNSGTMNKVICVAIMSKSKFTDITTHNPVAKYIKSGLKLRNLLKIQPPFHLTWCQVNRCHLSWFQVTSMQLGIVTFHLSWWNASDFHKGSCRYFARAGPSKWGFWIRCKPVFTLDIGYWIGHLFFW